MDGPPPAGVMRNPSHARMREAAGVDPEARQLQACVRFHLRDADLGRAGRARHRKHRWIHLPFEHRIQGDSGGGRAMDPDFGVPGVQQWEERQSLDVIPMYVGEQHVHPRRGREAERRTEAPDPGPSVEHQAPACAVADRHAGRVATVANRAFAGHGNRPARSPEGDGQTHRHFPLTAPVPCRPGTIPIACRRAPPAVTEVTPA